MSPLLRRIPSRRTGRAHPRRAAGARRVLPGAVRGPARARGVLRRAVRAPLPRVSPPGVAAELRAGARPGAHASAGGTDKEGIRGDPDQGLGDRRA